MIDALYRMKVLRSCAALMNYMRLVDQSQASCYQGVVMHENPGHRRRWFYRQQLH